MLVVRNNLGSSTNGTFGLMIMNNPSVPSSGENVQLRSTSSECIVDYYESDRIFYARAEHWNFCMNLCGITKHDTVLSALFRLVEWCFQHYAVAVLSPVDGSDATPFEVPCQTAYGSMYAVGIPRVQGGGWFSLAHYPPGCGSTYGRYKSSFLKNLITTVVDIYQNSTLYPRSAAGFDALLTCPVGNDRYLIRKILQHLAALTQNTDTEYGSELFTPVTTAGLPGLSHNIVFPIVAEEPTTVISDYGVLTHYTLTPAVDKTECRDGI